MTVSLYPCDRCERTDLASGDGSCATCDRRLLATLANLPRWYAECESALLPRRGPANQRVSGGSADRGLALNENALDVRDEIRSVLRSWVRLVLDEKPVSAPGSDPAQMCPFLSMHHQWLIRHPAGADFAEEILRLGRMAEHVLHLSTGIATRLGRCTRSGCGAPMTFVSGGTRSGPASVRCLDGHVWLPHEWLSLSRQAQGPR